MKKRIVSFFLVISVISMVFATGITAAAETIRDNESIYGWTKDSSTASEEQFNSCLVLSDEAALSGAHSIKIGKQDPQLKGVKINLRNTSVAGLEAGNYTVSLKMKGVTDSEQGGGNQPGINIHLEQNGADAQSGLQWWKAWGWTREELADGWFKFEKMFTTTEVMKQFYLELFEASYDMFIDDVSVVKEGTEENLLKNGDFEPLDDIIPSGWTRYSGGTNSAVYEPYSFTKSSEDAFAGENSLKVKAQSLKGIQLYLANNSVKGHESGTYTVSMFIKGSGKPCLQVLNGSGTKLFDLQYYSAQGVERTDAGNGWFKFEKTVTVTDGWKTLTLMVYDAPTAFYIDNISVVNSETGRNILEDGGFETVVNSFSPNTYPYNWYRTNSGSPTTEQLESSIELTDVTSFSGNNSIRVKKQALSGIKIFLRSNNFSVPLEAGTYTISMYIKGDGAPHLIIYMDSEVGNLQYYSAANVNWTRTDAAGGWYKFEKTVTLEKTVSQFCFAVYNANNEFFIDNISIVKAGGSDNVLENGDFEQVAKGENTYPNNTLPTGARLESRNVENYLSGNYFTVTDEDSYSGENALKIYCAESMSGKQIYITNDMISAEAGTYDISFCLKGAKNPHINLFINGFEGSKIALENEAAHADKRTTAANGWRRYSFTQSVDGSNKGFVIELFSTADVLIDDVSIVKQGTSENLLTNGSFENAYVPDCSVSKVYVENEVNYKALAQNNNLDSLSVMLTLATYVLNDEGEWVLYKTAADRKTIAKGEQQELCVPFDVSLIPEEDRYRFCTYIWNGETMMPFQSAVETIISY